MTVRSRADDIDVLQRPMMPPALQCAVRPKHETSLFIALYTKCQSSASKTLRKTK